MSEEVEIAATMTMNTMHMRMIIIITIIITIITVIILGHILALLQGLVLVLIQDTIVVTGINHYKCSLDQALSFHGVDLINSPLSNDSKKKKPEIYLYKAFHINDKEEEEETIAYDLCYKLLSFFLAFFLSFFLGKQTNKQTATTSSTSIAIHFLSLSKKK